MAYTIGDVVLTTVEFRLKSTNALVDPTAWQVEVQPPGGQVKFTLVFGVDGALTQVSSPGEFQFRQTTDRDTSADAGRWDYWVTSTGTGQASRPGHFIVDGAPIP